jgi:hypothetical protein
MINQNKKQRKFNFRIHRASYLMLAVTLIIIGSILVAPAFSISSSPCNTCHSGYSQNLDILEGNAANQLPTTLTVGQSASVSVIIENRVNTALYAALNGASLTLASQNGHFSVSAPVFNIGTLQKGTATAIWQITGVSAGSDTLLITASATNPHQNLAFTDSYSPAPTITVSTPATSPPTQTTTPTPPPPIPSTNPSSSPSPPSTSPDTTSIPTATSPSPSTPAQPSTTTNPGSTSVNPTPKPVPNVKTDSPTNTQTQNQPIAIWFIGPVEGEKLAAGDQTIAWATNGASGNASIKLELSKTGSSGPWITLAENFGTNGNYVWNVSNQDANYVIRATVINNANPQQTASVTVAAKVSGVIHLEAFIAFGSGGLLFFSIVSVAVFLDKRPAKIPI